MVKKEKTVVGSQNRTVTPNEAKAALAHCLKLQRPLMMWGAPGIGKSDIVKQIGEEQSRTVIDIRLPLWEPTDIKGIPLLQSKRKQHGLGFTSRIAHRSQIHSNHIPR